MRVSVVLLWDKGHGNLTQVFRFAFKYLSVETSCPISLLFTYLFFFIFFSELGFQHVVVVSLKLASMA